MPVRLVDTDVYSYLHARNPTRGLLYKQHLDAHVITLSFITVGEQYAGYDKQILRGKWDSSHLSRLDVRRKHFENIPGITVISEAP
jgi:hypothetical protein